MRVAEEEPPDLIDAGRRADGGWLGVCVKQRPPFRRPRKKSATAEVSSNNEQEIELVATRRDESVLNTAVNKPILESRPEIVRSGSALSKLSG